MEPPYEDFLVLAFRKWRNGKVKIWDYSPSHSRLTLRVESHEHPGNLHIVCGGCLSIRGPFKWDKCDFEIKSRTNDEMGKIKVLMDKSSGFELHCAVVSVKENVAPVYFTSLGNREKSA